MAGNVFEAEPNKNWRSTSCKGLELTYKTAKRTKTHAQNSLHGRPSWLHFLPCEWLGVSIPHMEIGFTGCNKFEGNAHAWLKALFRLRFGNTSAYFGDTNFGAKLNFIPPSLGIFPHINAIKNYPGVDLLAPNSIQSGQSGIIQSGPKSVKKKV